MKTIPFDGELSEEHKKNILFWIEELRSKKWRQGREYLWLKDLDGDHYCCLGVACELHSIDNMMKIKTPKTSKSKLIEQLKTYYS